MNSKLWIRKALSLCLVVATMATYSMVTLANSKKVSGELLISGADSDSATSFIKVNGEPAQNGRSIFSSSTIVTPDNSSAIINLSKLGRVELSPNTTLTLSFDVNGINADLLAGRLTVLNASSAVNVKTLDGTVNLKAGESAIAAPGKAQDDDDAVSDGGSGWIVWALVLGGAAAGIIIAATSDNNRVTLGGNSTVISPTR